MRKILLIMGLCCMQVAYADSEVVKAVPDTALLHSPFGADDVTRFREPMKNFFPETWFHFINGNVDKEGITEDLKAIAESGLVGVQFFHGGGFADGWKGVKEPVYCLSDKWEDLLKYTASEANRFGLRFTMQNCPGWSMSGGPWIDFDHTMRHLSYTSTYLSDGQDGDIVLPKNGDSEDPKADYRDLMVLAFPTPANETTETLYQGNFGLGVATSENPHVIDIILDKPQVARTLEFNSIWGFDPSYATTPGVKVRAVAIDRDGHTHEVLPLTDMPGSNWQDNKTMSFALNECENCQHYQVHIVNQHDMNLSSLRLLAPARQQNWEMLAGWTLRQLVNNGYIPTQSPTAYVKKESIVDLTDKMDEEGRLDWKKPHGDWTILRIGHVNTRHVNVPAPPEATGWECDKLDHSGADLQFNNYIGRLASGPLKGLLSNMLMDSWECQTQTWTKRMPEQFERVAGYPIRMWIPALLGYVLDDPETTTKFLNDWRFTLNDLYVNEFFGTMVKNAHEKGLTCSYETAAGDITPADPMEYYKFADVPMCEFWQPFSGYLSDRTYKPIRPTSSAAHLYGKPRVSAESFTSIDLTWDEHLQMLKDIANQNLLHGMTHFVFHTYTHNPGATKYFPGTSFGTHIGTPFMRSETWWKHMPAFTSYLARCTYMLERGKPNNAVLWYLGDETQQKPDQYNPFPVGYNYDYCNPDALLNRIDVQDGHWVTPDGIRYPLMWIPEQGRMLPETLERLQQLVEAGGVLLAEKPLGIATLRNKENQQLRYFRAVQALWANDIPGIHPIKNGKVITGMGLEDALRAIGQKPDVLGAGNQWLHRTEKGADWYFLCADKESEFHNTVSFNNTGRVEIWNPVNGKTEEVPVRVEKGRTLIDIDMKTAECLFVVFNHDNRPSQAKEWKDAGNQDISSQEWTVTFPSGWGIDQPITTTQLLPWKELVTNGEGRAFSGTATYSTTLNVNKYDKKARYNLQLGRVDMIAVVRVNGQEMGTLWTEPYQVDITEALHKGQNQVEIDVTSSWFNRLVYDDAQPEENRKTWCICGPGKDSELKEY